MNTHSGTHITPQSSMDTSLDLPDLETENPVFNIKAAARLCDTSASTSRRWNQVARLLDS